MIHFLFQGDKVTCIFSEVSIKSPSSKRTLEGIGILKLILEENGYVQFKIKKISIDTWDIDISPENIGKKCYALYTGTETSIEKEMIRNIFNSNWESLPQNIIDKLKSISSNNFMGEIIQTLMITSSGAEGISLQNVQYVHIVEPYWHPVRIEQVIGRARRICSHKNLDEKFQKVDVFLYLMQFSEEQLKSDKSIELRLKDKSKLLYYKDDKGFLIECKLSQKEALKKDGFTCNYISFTSDQALYEISTIKENLNKSILKNIKEASIDCTLFNDPSKKSSINCMSFGSDSVNKFSYLPNYKSEEIDEITRNNKIEKNIKAQKITYQGIDYAYDKESKKLYNYRSWISDNPIQVGTLVIEGKNFKLNWI